MQALPDDIADLEDDFNDIVDNGGMIYLDGMQFTYWSSFLDALKMTNMSGEILHAELEIVRQNMREAEAPLQILKPALNGRKPICKIISEPKPETAPYTHLTWQK
jgi:hypothetical protein